VRLSWCVLQEKLIMLETDVEVVLDRTGGRAIATDTKPEPFVTMTDVQVKNRIKSSPPKLTFDRSHGKYSPL